LRFAGGDHSFRSIAIACHAPPQFQPGNPRTRETAIDRPGLMKPYEKSAPTASIICLAVMEKSPYYATRLPQSHFLRKFHVPTRFTGVEQQADG
jgi:hypothetical protein